jgi:peptidoglycan/xylan/chitin deacetylase (PgdA/CDA1 family)
MTMLHRALFSSWARGHLLCRVEDVSGRFALTFDDGPSLITTPRLLDVLARHQARATFFVLAPNVRRAPQLTRRIAADGHELALHGNLHWPLVLSPPWMIRTEIKKCARAVHDVTGVRARFFRPPFGFMMPGQSAFVRHLGYESVLGDVYPEDPRRPGTARIASRVMRRLRAGSILILHDGSPAGERDRTQTVEAVDMILHESSQQGLAAVSVAELLNAAPAT